ncbi:MAG: malate synthase A [Candidatus Promineifilaceae bacterium]
MTMLRGIELLAPVSPEYAEILTPDALHFVALLARMFENRRQDLLQRRVERQAELDAGILPDFLPHTAAIRDSDWTVAPIPPDLQDRRVEITGPPDRKMIINALNSGASVYMADFEDAHSPTWDNTIQGQINLRDAVNRAITYTSPEGKFYQLQDVTATLMVRPRGWHLPEKHLLIDGKPISGALFDFGLFFFHNAHNLMQRGSGPYFYLPKLENHLEARLWNDVFNLAQDTLGIPRGTIRATVLIENILASYEMDEILYELRDHSAGLNCGRWDYIFSAIRKFRHHPRFILPNRAQVTMTTHFMRAYSLLLIKTCHRRGIHAMGGMAAQIPIKGDPVANEIALDKVRADKERESKDGHDGTWVAHPGLVAIAKEVFDRHMPAANQIARQREDVRITAQDLLPVAEGDITEEGVRLNIDVALQYLASWLGGNGCVPIYNLMEDAATAEISRAQLWQWVHNSAAHLSDGRRVSAALYQALVPRTMTMIEEMVGAAEFNAGNYARARHLLDQLVLSETFTEFLTLPAYQYLN